MELADIDAAIEAEEATIDKAQARLATLRTLRLQFAERTHSVSNMQAAESVRPRRARRGRPPTNDHAFTKALDAKGSSLAEWARKHRVGEAKVKGWVRDVDGRRIPRAIAEKIETEMGKDENDRPIVPATLDTWKNGIS